MVALIVIIGPVMGALAAGPCFQRYQQEGRITMDLGANFAQKLEPFLLMAKTMKGAAAAKLIQDATAAPGVFVFSELLELPNIQDLGKSEQHEKYLSLLQLFAYKTYQDYLKHKEQLPPLNQAQLTKLKYLSIVTMATEKRILPYSTLLSALEMPTVRDLEDLIIDAIYLDILRGKLDQKEGVLEVEYTMGRDIPYTHVPQGKAQSQDQVGGVADLESILASLKDWASTTSSLLSTLDVAIASAAQDSANKKADKEAHDGKVQIVLKDVVENAKKDKEGGRDGTRGGHGQGASGSGGGGERSERDRPKRGNSGTLSGGGDRMDVDEPILMEGGSGSGIGLRGSKNRKAPQAEVLKPQRKRNRM
ncbi:hypothetical protein D9758_014933 [Tetrapyrgos nigripes]|uniref:PCI domain-containing protein n=1 Tax=Tetrapyrgos nigripes TaxID=182062 RepID=A0A8H5CBB0_9AGAR|nr:hypothetical protein D9758_014933 [Tetrapyrgos nigripes]